MVIQFKLAYSLLSSLTLNQLSKNLFMNTISNEIIKQRTLKFDIPISIDVFFNIINIVHIITHAINGTFIHFFNSLIFSSTFFTS